MIESIVIDDNDTKLIIFEILVQQEIESLLNNEKGLQGQG